MTGKIYIVDSNKVNYDDIKPYIQQLDEDRQKQIGQYQRHEDKKRSLIAGLLLRFAFKQRYPNMYFPDISTTKFGKPYIDSRFNFRFNISHSGKYVVVATCSIEVGCDVQEMEEGYKDIANNFFSPNEQKYVFNCPGEQEDRFYRLWVLKESYLKLKSCGIGKLRETEIQFEENSIFVKNANQLLEYFFEERTLDNYKLSVCTEQKIEWKIEEIPYQCLIST